MHFTRLLTAVLIIGLPIVACEGPAGPEGTRGPQGEEGPQGPEGTANATLYKFDGNDFSVNGFTERYIELENEAEVTESSWLVYLVYRGRYFHIPGMGRGQLTHYYAFHHWQEQFSRARVVIDVESGNGESYEEIHIIRIQVSNVVDSRSKVSVGLIPDDLNAEDYHSVLEYFGIQI